MTLREVTAIVLLFNACRDETVRRRVLQLLPELDELIDGRQSALRLVVPTDEKR